MHGILKREGDNKGTSKNFYKAWYFACIWFRLEQRTRNRTDGESAIDLENCEIKEDVVSWEGERGKEIKGGLGIFLVEGIWAQNSY